MSQFVTVRDLGVVPTGVGVNRDREWRAMEAGIVVPTGVGVNRSRRRDANSNAKSSPQAWG